MLFTLKKVLGGMMLPLPLLLLLMAIGIILLWRSRFQKNRQSAGHPELAVADAVKPAAGGRRVVKTYRKSYPTRRGGQSVEYVVVLGGGYTRNPQWAPSSNLINNSLPRLAEGIRLWRENPCAKMIFTGAAAKTNPVSTAEAGARRRKPRRTAQRDYRP